MSNEDIFNDVQKQKDLVHAVRDMFFEDLLEEWSRPPELIDRLMAQDEFFLAPDFSSNLKNHPETIMIKDVSRGLLAVSVTPQGNFSGDEDAGGVLYPAPVRIVYSVMQAGDWIRFGFLLQGDPRMLVSYQQHNDHLLSVESIWDRPCDYQFRDHGGLLVEWRFHEPDFYNNYVIRERFKIIVRHLHFRLGRSVMSLFDQPVMDWTPQPSLSPVSPNDIDASSRPLSSLAGDISLGDIEELDSDFGDDLGGLSEDLSSSDFQADLDDDEPVGSYRLDLDLDLPNTSQ